jgi:hypothetical protein
LATGCFVFDNPQHCCQDCSRLRPGAVRAWLGCTGAVCPGQTRWRRLCHFLLSHHYDHFWGAVLRRARAGSLGGSRGGGSHESRNWRCVDEWRLCSRFLGFSFVRELSCATRCCFVPSYVGSNLRRAGITVQSTETMESCLQQLATQVSLQVPTDGVAVSRAVHAMTKSLSVLTAAGSQHSAQNVVSLTVDAIGKIAVQYVPSLECLAVHCVHH